MTYQQTSAEAYESVGHASIAKSIIAEIEANGPMTCDDLEVVLDRLHQTVSAGIRHLVQAGTLVKTEETGVTRTGRKAIRWGIA